MFQKVEIVAKSADNDLLELSNTTEDGDIEDGARNFGVTTNIMHKMLYDISVAWVV